MRQPFGCGTANGNRLLDTFHRHSPSDARLPILDARRRTACLRFRIRIGLSKAGELGGAHNGRCAAPGRHLRRRHNPSWSWTSKQTNSSSTAVLNFSGRKTSVTRHPGEFPITGGISPLAVSTSTAARPNSTELHVRLRLRWRSRGQDGYLRSRFDRYSDSAHWLWPKPLYPPFGCD